MCVQIWHSHLIADVVEMMRSDIWFWCLSNNPLSALLLSGEGVVMTCYVVYNLGE